MFNLINRWYRAIKIAPDTTSAQKQLAHHKADELQARIRALELEALVIGRRGHSRLPPIREDKHEP